MPSPRPAAWWHARADELRRLSNPQFIAQFGVTQAAVSRWRVRLGIPSPVPRGRPRGRGKGARWTDVDWGKPNAQIAAEMGVSTEAVGQQRRARGMPPVPYRRPKKPAKPKPPPQPLGYWRHHLADLRTLSVAEVMAKHRCSAAAVYHARSRAGASKSRRA